MGSVLVHVLIVWGLVILTRVRPTDLSHTLGLLSEGLPQTGVVGPCATPARI